MYKAMQKKTNVIILSTGEPLSNNNIDVIQVLTYNGDQ